MSLVDVLARLTSQARVVLSRKPSLEVTASTVGLDQVRRSYAEERAYWNEGGPVMARTFDTTVPGPTGDVAIRVHRPFNAPETSPVIVFLHGGGFVVGSVETHDRIMRTLAERARTVVVGVDYFLSPEARFPQAVHQCAAVVAVLRERATDLGIDPDHLSFAGDSSGANLSLATTLYLRDTTPEAPVVRSLLLYYGMFGLRDSVSRRLYGGAWDGLTRTDLENYMRCYTSAPEDLDSPYLDCLAAPDLAMRLPPCYVVAAALDPLRDDSVALAAVLAEAGTLHRFRVVEGVLHGFLHHARMLPEAVAVLEDGAEFFRNLPVDSTGSPVPPGGST